MNILKILYHVLDNRFKGWAKAVKNLFAPLIFFKNVRSAKDMQMLGCRFE